MTIPSICENFIGTHVIVLEILAVGKSPHPIPQKTTKRQAKGLSWRHTVAESLKFGGTAISEPSGE